MYVWYPGPEDELDDDPSEFSVYELVCEECGHESKPALRPDIDFWLCYFCREKDWCKRNGGVWQAKDREDFRKFFERKTYPCKFADDHKEVK